MGVKGLWKLIESAGVPVPLETLEHKVLGVDVSIWLHQAVRGFRGPGGAAVANAHLLTLFHRICKLLFYRIRPIFVFDGGVPHLKKQTLASRKLRKEVATNKARQARERLFKNLLKSQAVRAALGKSGPGPSSVHVPQVTKREKDLFELPPLSEALEEGTSETPEEERSSNIVQCVNLPNLHQFDLDSEEFKDMPLDMRHEILSELQDTRKQNSWATINDMPQQSENFAAFQMGRLMKRAKFQATLDSTREEIQKAKVSEMEAELFGDVEKYMSLSQRIISEDASHAIFVKKVKETSKSNSETMDVESYVPVKKADKKGKAPLNKKKPIDKDFLTELAKVGIIRPDSHVTDSDSDVESDNFHLLHEDGEEDWNDNWQNCSKEDESFLWAVGSLMENSGLTQDEILTLIKEDQRENAVVECKNELHDGPSTSANAPGSIFNPDDSSSDEDNFIEVTNDVQSPWEENGGEKKEILANNIDKLLGTKTNSLWMKIVQQKVDDMVQVSTLKASPKKAIIDSRKPGKEKAAVEEHTTCKEISETLKPVKISLDFEVKPLKMEDNIFSDIFTDIICQPKSVKMNRLITEESQGSRLNTGAQDIVVNESIKPNLNCNSQTRMDYVEVNRCAESKLSAESYSIETPNAKVCDANLSNITSIKTVHLDYTHTKCKTPLQNADIVGRNKAEDYISSAYWRGKSEKSKLTHDEVEIMSSSDETDDEHDVAISTALPSPHAKTMESQSPSSRILLEHQNTNALKQMSHKSMTFHNEDSSIQLSKSIVCESKDTSKTGTTLIKNTLYENRCTDNIDSEISKLAVLKDEKINNSQHVTLISQNFVDQAFKTTPLYPRKSSYVEHKNSTSSSQPLDSSSEDGNLEEVEGGSREILDMKEKKDKQEESKVSRQSHDHSDSSSESTKKYKNTSREDISTTKVEIEAIILSDHGGNRNRIISEHIKQRDVINTTEGSVGVEAKLNPDTDVEEKWEENGTAEKIEMEKTKVERPLDYTEDELKQLEGELASEQQALVAQAQQCERLASSLNDQMYGESQHLLQLFGIPYLVAPMEAEAQCAFLNAANLTEGTITDDSDIFLFGGNSVYRNFFNQTRHVEHYKTENIKATVGLERTKMITLALICGSDYTEGVEGIGSVGAMEALVEFPGEGIECLQNLRKWWSVACKGISTMQHSKIRQKLAQVNLPDSFPNENVYEAYLLPEVDESREKFTWAVPNVEALRVFTAEKFGWNHTKTDEILLPVMKKLKIRTTQKRIESYFTNIRLVKEPKVTSKRMQDAIAKSKGTALSNSDHPVGQSGTQVKVRQKQKKRKVTQDSERKQASEESKPSCSMVMADSKHSKPTRTLLVDPSEIKNKSVIEGRKRQKRKNDFGETKINEISQKKVTKEDMFKSLLEKETICQREKEKLKMEEKKMKAANILHKQNKVKKTKKR